MRVIRHSHHALSAVCASATALFLLALPAQGAPAHPDESLGEGVDRERPSDEGPSRSFMTASSAMQH